MNKLLDFRQVNSAISLHGGMDQFDRDSTIADFSCRERSGCKTADTSCEL